MFRKKIKLLKRFKEISATLSKLGFYNIYDYFKILFGIEVEPGAKPRRIRETLERLGPSFIKLGQILSTRPDIVPVYIIDSYIDPNPLASASISQVHTGYLKTGEKVAIKVKRPNLEQIIELDSELMYMVVEFLERHFENVGTKISEVDTLKKKGLDPEDIAIRLTDAYFKMVFIDGVYHADPHPGNLFVLDDGTIVAIDFGMIAFLSKSKKKYFFDYIIAVTTLDLNLAIQFYEGFNMFTPRTDFGNFEADLQFFLEKYHNKRLDEINLREMIEDIIGFIRENHLKLPTDIAYLGKAALNLEGTVRELSFYLIFKLEHIYRLLIRERVTFQIIFKDIEELQKFYKMQTGKIAFAIIFVGMLISSALFYLTGKDTTGLVLLVISFFVGLISFYKVFRF